MSVFSNILGMVGGQGGSAGGGIPQLFLSPPSATPAAADPAATADAARNRRLRGRGSQLLFGSVAPDPSGGRQSGATLLGQ